MTYQKFLQRRMQPETYDGFDPVWQPEFLFDFQQALVEWAVRKGRAAIFADCGLGKTPMQLVWAENVARFTGKPVLILTPLAVAHQTLHEAEKFGIEAEVSRDGSFSKHIVVTNYERLHYFDRNNFVGCVCDESSAIKAFDGKRRQQVTDFLSHIRYRLLCTATAAPNDFHELGTSSEALGYLGYRDMLTEFFKQETQKDSLGWGRTKYRLRGHAEIPFWRWVCSFARAIRKPSDLGFSDDRFILPPLNQQEILVRTAHTLPGRLFAVAAETLQEQRQERRATIRERCEKVASLVEGKTAVVWCHLNDEGDLLEKIIPDAMQVSGSMSDELKEERMQAFSEGSLPVLITKPKIGCWGLNWQHCSEVSMFPSHSFEQYYQAIRRCYRIGQENTVNVNIVTTEGEVGVVKNLQRKQAQTEAMFANLVACMNESLSLSNRQEYPQEERVPAWL